jgi:tetratricopeptide (TPR) repeat protein
MVRTSLLCVVALFCLEACTALGPGRSTLTPEQVLSGSALPWAASALPAAPSEEEAFGLDGEMRAFVAPLRAIEDPVVRLTRLREAMQQRGLFSIVYNGSSTRTARRVFHERQGNCLSFTMLFVALARAAGLEARYQLVDVPRTFNSEGGALIVDTHVNAAVLAPFGRKFFIDFNTANFRSKYPIRAISDRYALALFYNNLGAEALVRQEYPLSFAMLREAARTHADIPGTWVNLGVLYTRHGLHDHAEVAELRALAADPTEQSALANLVAIYSALGDTELADEYRQRIRRWRDMNPYYHFGVAQALYDQKRFDDALISLQSAIRLKRDEDEFYLLQGRAFTEVGRPDRAIASFAHAKELAAARE